MIPAEGPALLRCGTSSARTLQLDSVASGHVWPPQVDIELPLLRRNVEGSSDSSDLEIRESMLVDLEGADWSADWLLRFRDARVERQYCDALYGQRRTPGAVMCMFWLLFCFFDFLSQGASEWLWEDDIAANLTGWGRILNMTVLFFSALAMKLSLIHTETVGCFIMFWMPLMALLNNPYRMSKLFETDHYQRRFVDRCGADTCYDDSVTILILLIINSAPLLLSWRLATSWLCTPWSAFLYGVFSLTGIGPMSRMHHVMVLTMYSSLCAFMVVGSYRIEHDRRRRWCENLRLRTEMAVQRVELVKQEDWLREVNEKLEAMGAPNSMAPTAAETALTMNTMESEACGVRTALQVPLPAVSAVASAAAAADADVPNALLVRAMAGRKCDAARLRRMAERIQDEDYGLRAFFEDALAAFPELELFCCAGDGSEPDTSSGHSSATEYQRTVGALFAVFWLMRLNGDGKLGFCYGYDDDWELREWVPPVNARHTPLEGQLDRPAGPRTRRARFYEEMEWSYMAELVDAGLGSSLERLQAMLSLTAFHDIMKVQALCPVVSAAHAPYHGFQAGDRIHDHDVALAYLLEHYPEVLPSFRALPPASRGVILFTQSKMCFNHGWFVQAEAPPGPMLSEFKAVLKKASPPDLAFYFLHWLTDLSGAEGQPLAGAEKFVLRFPRAVLSSFLWSIPYLQKLSTSTETAAVESYLEARFRTALPSEALPEGEEAVALLRLVVMAQGGAHLVLGAFRSLPFQAQRILSAEFARTGIAGQSFRRSPARGGPALFVYYGPALLQLCSTEQEMASALRILAAAFHAARLIWPVSAAASAQAVTIEGGSLKANASILVSGQSCVDGKILVLERRSSFEAAVRLVAGSSLNALLQSGTVFWAMDLEDFATLRTADPESIAEPASYSAE